MSKRLVRIELRKILLKETKKAERLFLNFKLKITNFKSISNFLMIKELFF